MTIGLIIAAFLSFTLAWWHHQSDEILLNHYNAYVSFENTNIFEISYKDVLPENLNKVKKIERSYMGIE